ncbi:hypothetical protein PHSC3_000937 [Chlamydiales bacterium STE3]|nr:hypothetical protein PHSC3_000937 [Chlamydiales bacterium STE3]
MPISDIHLSLQANLKKKVHLKINDNRSTMLSVRWESDCTKVSLHRMFLEAPKNVMEELACYVRQESKNISHSVKAFIEDRLKNLDYTHLLKPSKLISKGNVYDLQAIYDTINAEYFDSKLKLFITWFGKPHQKNRTRVTFGLYHDPMKLIKINRLLDSPVYPDYLVSYVVYHEMLHHVCPSYYDEKGIHRIHSKEFKSKEELFKHYDLAQNWIKQHTQYLFNIN